LAKVETPATVDAPAPINTPAPYRNRSLAPGLSLRRLPRRLLGGSAACLPYRHAGIWPRVGVESADGL